MKPNKFDAVIALVGPNKHFGVTIECVLEWHEDPSEKPTEEENKKKEEFMKKFMLKGGGTLMERYNKKLKGK